MQVNIKSRNGKLTEQERSYLTDKLQKLQRYSDGIGDVTVEIARLQQRSAGEVHVVQATLRADHGVIIRAEERDHDFMTSIDALHDHLQRQLTRYKERHYRRGHVDRSLPQAGTTETPQAANGIGNDTSAGHLVKTKQFRYKPMSTEEAIEQMELLDHDFFVFTDAESQQVSVVYRRRDGNYGLIEQDAVEAE